MDSYSGEGGGGNVYSTLKKGEEGNVTFQPVNGKKEGGGVLQ